MTSQEVEESRRIHGSNVISPVKGTPAWKLFLAKFKDPLIVVLMVAGVLSIGISFYEYYGLGGDLSVFFDPVGIFVAILLATGLAFIFEHKAEKEFAILNKVNDVEPVRVIRNGSPAEIGKDEVVVGDIVLISIGEEIPADGVLLESTSLRIDESSFTGEPSCMKSSNPIEIYGESTYPSNVVLRGSTVLEGHGVMRVSAVGDQTENGKVLEAVQIDNSVKTPLNEQLSRLGSAITWVSYGIAGVIVVARIVYFIINTPGFEFMELVAAALQSIMIAVTLIVVAVPEGLPMAVVLSLAYSMRRMLRTNNLVRRLHACETMGAATVICTDKTGTLTESRMQVAHTFFNGKLDDNDNIDSNIVKNIAINSTALLENNNDKIKVLGNPTEGALLLWLKNRGIDYMTLREQNKVLAELSFTTELKYMATVVTDGERRLLLVKGAPEVVMGFTRRYIGTTRQVVEQQLLAFQNKAMRTLALAYCELNDNEVAFNESGLLLHRLVFQGIVAISDPVRPTVPAAVQECIEAGIDVKLITGDNQATACEVARQIGLITPNDGIDEVVISGPEISDMPDEQLTHEAKRFKIISRARPLDKKRLVEALQRSGDVVAVTGDGTNDAPALHAAHVGLSMGSGTSVAKQASDITIIDDSFSSIGQAVMWGRSLFRNIQRFILFQMIVNVVACLIVLCGAFIDFQSPLTVTQMLWVNLIMDTFAAMALASLPPSHQVMRDKPRNRRDFIIDRHMAKYIAGIGLTLFAVLMAILWVMEHAQIGAMTDFLSIDWQPKGHLDAYELSLFFTIFVMLQFWNMFNARAYLTGESALKLKDCRGFLTIATIIILGQLLIVNIGGKMFNVVPLTLTDWVIIIVSTSIVLWIGETHRALSRRHVKKVNKT